MVGENRPLVPGARGLFELLYVRKQDPPYSPRLPTSGKARRLSITIWRLKWRPLIQEVLRPKRSGNLLESTGLHSKIEEISQIAG